MQKKGRKYCLAVGVCLTLQYLCYGQPSAVEALQNSTLPALQNVLLQTDTSKSPFIISDIIITGRKKTKDYIIEREIPFRKGDSVSLSELVNKFELARRQLMNTRLFNDVVVSLKSFRGYFVDVQIDVKERWYLFPIPYFKPVDRNLSEWSKQGYGLQRVNYGAKLSYHNVTGRNDKLRAWFITGYTRQIEFSYEQPNADKSLKHGYGVTVSYATAKEINHTTENNEQKFIPLMQAENTVENPFLKGQVLNEQFNLALSYTYRPAIRTRHSVRLSLHSNRIDEAVTFANPNYFKNGNTHVLYPELSYLLEYNNIDYVAYPLKGFIGDAGIVKRGIGSNMDMWQLTAKGTRGWEIANKTFYGLQGYGVLKLPFDQPYFNQRLFGYGDLYLRGLEKYVIDGVAAGMIRNTLRRQILQFSVPFTHLKSHDKIPVRIYLKAYGDMGYAHNKNFPQNSLVNRMLYTAGAGVDLVTFYDLVLRFEYSCNQLGQKGLFFHFKSEF